MELGDFEMGINQLARLSDWLKTKGLTAEDFDECVHYIAQMEQKPTKKKSGPHRYQRTRNLKPNPKI